MTYLGYFFLNILALITSVALFLGTIRFGDHIIAFFKRK